MTSNLFNKSTIVSLSFVPVGVLFSVSVCRFSSQEREKNRFYFTRPAFLVVFVLYKIGARAFCCGFFILDDFKLVFFLIEEREGRSSLKASG